MFKIVVSAADAAVKEKETITQGRVGLQCRFRFSPEWKGLAKTAVFAGAEDRDVIITGDTVTVPAECLSEANRPLVVGVCGKSGDGAVVIPTVYVQLGQIEPGACPGGKEPAAPTPDVVAQIQQAAANAEAMARSVRDDADLGKFIGPAGEPGGWYTPEIKQPIKGAMVVNFSPSKEGMPEAASKMIFLPQGDAGADGGYYTPAVTQPDENTMHVEFTPSKADMPAVDPTDITLPNGSGGGGSGADGKSAYEYAVEGGYTGTEAEFAQKLAQEKYASPNALTFTGAVEGSYDGSEAVTVEIPSGGGGSAIDGYTLIKTITLESDVSSFNISTDENGDALRISEAVITMQNPAATAEDCYTTITGEKGSTGQRAIGKWAQTSATRNIMRLSRVNGLLLEDHRTGIGTHYNGVWNGWSDLHDIGLIKSIGIRTSSHSYFKTGAVIKVYTRG